MTITTKPTKENFKKVLALLAETPGRLQTLSSARSAAELSAPLEKDQWSFAEIMGHLDACAELNTHATYYALLVDNPILPDVHPQRQWARLLRYQEVSFTDMQGNFDFRRELLLRKLNLLSGSQWLRPVTRQGKRQENIYRIARSMALHEHDHLTQLEAVLF